VELDYQKLLIPAREFKEVSRQNENVTLLSKVKMSPLAGEVCECVLVLMRPRGVAPERMPKADATELAPE
jgi:hypothetical protein